ncbi:MAG: hypothetical protein QOD57_4302 [Actinomycetota bacterium]|nr:hypothetical protein [Actinomycetota bacterium]MDQ1506575.1 hypothetical protein [Actinomycetota bacterium]
MNRSDPWSPKQLARRALIVAAAVETMRRDGIAGCTVRSIASATPFSKGTVHYYFADVREIVDAAYLQLTDEYVSAIDAVADGETQPAEAFWRAVRSYLEGFKVHRRLGLLWFEYTSWAVRHEDQQGVASSVEAIRRMFERRLLAIDPDKGDRVVVLVRYLLGAVLELSSSGVPVEDLLADVGRICGLEAPPRRRRADHARDCPVCRQPRRTGP